MEQFQEYRDQAQKKVSIADHMLTMTYPLVRDPKLLLAALDNVLQALEHGMTAILTYERTFKRIPPFPSSFEGKLMMFQHKVVSRLGIPKSYVILIRDVHQLRLYQKKSDIEFIRRGKFVMSDSNYNLKTIDVDTVKEFITKTKGFLKVVWELTSNDRIFT